MSPFLPRVAARRAARTLTLALTLMAPGGCHQRSSQPARPSAAEPSIRSGRGSTDEQLGRRFPGLSVSRTPSGGVSIRVLTALVGDGPPLYIIDGTPMHVDPGRGIDWLRLEDIEHVRLLKDPSDTAVYGPRGANGVILVTTQLAARTRPRGH
jgi:TonB-dependent SusC/RagA subfamily outer membrane receptor